MRVPLRPVFRKRSSDGSLARWSTSIWKAKIRLAFLTAGGSTALANRLPPEVVEQWPRCDQRGLVFVVGELLLGLVELEGRTSKTPIGQIIQRCLAKEPARRFGSIKELREALVDARGRRNAVEGVSQPEVWDRVEAGIGYLAIGQATQALQRFEAALQRDPMSIRARACRSEALRQGADAAAPLMLNFSSAHAHSRVPEPERRLAWADVASTARQLEDERNFREALSIYEVIRFEGADRVALDTSLARCHFHLGNSGHAIDYARRALARMPGHEEALEIRVNALLQRKQYAEALGCAEEWIAVAPSEGLAHHARGKSLFGLARLIEAREAFDRACGLRAQLIGAMLLRREVDRALKNVRATVGSDIAQTLDIPEYLAELRDVIVGGRIPDAIQMLRRPDYEHDAVAQLLLAELLSFDGRFDEALAVYESGQLGDERALAAHIGKAWTLLELGRAADAVALFDRVIAERGDEIDALEGRARALQLLGRLAEADAAGRKIASITGDRSNRRVRSIRMRKE